jgi:chromosome segregation ATPase
MSQMLPELQAEVRTLQAEITTLQKSREKLYKQRSSCRVAVSFPKNNTPEAIAEFHQQTTAFGEQWLQQLEEIDRETRTMEKQLQQKESVLNYKQAEMEKMLAGQHWQEIEHKIQAGEKHLQVQIHRINQIAMQLEAEIRSLKALSDEFSPSYAEWFQQPTQVVEFSVKTIPQVVAKNNGFVLENKEIDWG